MTGAQKEKDMRERASVVYMATMLFGFPLFYHNNYIDIIQAKKYFFLIATFFYFLCCLIKVLADWKKKSHIRREFKISVNRVKKIDGMDLFAVLLFFSLLMSTVLSKNQADAFWGYSGHCMGAVVMFAGILAYFLLSRYLKVSQTVLWSYLSGSGILFFLIICSTFQVDLLKMKENLAPSEHYFFVGTFGNIDVTAGFTVIMVPVGMVLFYFAKERLSKVIYGAYLFLGYAALFCCRCDTAVVCISSVFIVIYWFAFISEGGMCKAQWMFFLWIAASIFVLMLRNFFAYRTYTFDGMSLLAVSFSTILIEILLWGILQGYAWWAGKANEQAAKKIRGVLYGVFAVVVLFSMLCFIWVNIWININVDGTILQKFKMTDEIGNNRGFIWIRSVKTFFGVPILRKLFGYGMNQFPVFIEKYEEEMLVCYQSVFVDAHNELLQMVAVAGIVGCIGYFGMFVCCVKKCFRGLGSGVHMTEILGLSVMAAYLVQGITNSPQVFTTPLYFIFLGLFRGIGKSQN